MAYIDLHFLRVCEISQNIYQILSNLRAWKSSKKMPWKNIEYGNNVPKVCLCFFLLLLRNFAFNSIYNWSKTSSFVDFTISCKVYKLKCINNYNCSFSPFNALSGQFHFPFENVSKLSEICSSPLAKKPSRRKTEATKPAVEP